MVPNLFCTASCSQLLSADSFPHSSTEHPTSPQHPHRQTRFSTCTHSHPSCRFIRANFERAGDPPENSISRLVSFLRAPVHRRCALPRPQGLPAGLVSQFTVCIMDFEIGRAHV